MRRSTTALLAWAALTHSAAAASWNPFHKKSAEESWIPPAETGIAHPNKGDEKQLELGWSPRPTEAPQLRGRYAAMMFERQDDNTLGSETCGFNPAGNSYTCVAAGATCTYSDDYIGCCNPSSSCNAVVTSCIDYSSSANGACDIVDDFHTICCGTSAFGQCFTWVLSTLGHTYSLYDCSAAGGTSTLLTYNPSLGVPSTSASETSTEEETSASTASETATATATDEPAPKKKSNVGAIAGGAVGGVAVLALIGVGIFFLLRKKKNTPEQQQQQLAAVPPAQPQPPMGKTPQSPAPTSPGGSIYPSGVPPNYQGYSQQGTPQPYDPRMSAYGQQTPFTPQSGYSAVSPQQQFQAQYPPQGFEQQGYQQQSQYPSQYGAVAGYQPPSTGSPPPNLTPSPGPKENEAVGVQQNQQQQPPQHQHQQSHNAQELPAINPIGMETNRAELG